MHVVSQCLLYDGGAIGQRNADSANCSTEEAARVSYFSKLYMRGKMGKREPAWHCHGLRPGKDRAGLCMYVTQHCMIM